MWRARGGFVASIRSLSNLAEHPREPCELDRAVDDVFRLAALGFVTPNGVLRGERDRLAFDFGSTPPAGFVAVLARAESGRVIWYLPSAEDMASVALAEHTVAGVLDSVAVIDGTYAPGRYEVFAVMSPRPLDRAEIRGFAQGDRLIAPPGIRIDTRSFVIRSEEKFR